MTSSGRRIAFFIAVAIAFLLPKRVECGYANASCPADQRCVPYEIEPWGFYLIELLARRDIGFAYSSDTDCH